METRKCSDSKTSARPPVVPRQCLHLAAMHLLSSVQHIPLPQTVREHLSLPCVCTGRMIYLSLIPGWGDRSPRRSPPGSFIGILGHLGSGCWCTTPAEPGQSSTRCSAIFSAPLPCRKWRSPNVQYSEKSKRYRSV